MYLLIGQKHSEIKIRLSPLSLAPKQTPHFLFITEALHKRSLRAKGYRLICEEYTSKIEHRKGAAAYIHDISLTLVKDLTHGCLIPRIKKGKSN